MDERYEPDESKDPVNTSLHSETGAQMTLPSDIKSEVENMEAKFSESADSAIYDEYSKIGAVQFIKRVGKEEVHDFLLQNQAVDSPSSHPVLDDSGEIVSYDIYRINENALRENPEAVQRIRALSADLSNRIRTQELQLLNAAVAQGRAEDLGEMSVDEWAQLPDDILDNGVRIHLYDEEGNRLNKVKVFKII